MIYRASIVLVMSTILLLVPSVMASSSLSPKKSLRAQHRYGKLWNQARRYYGARGKSAPIANFNTNKRSLETAGMWVDREKGIPRVYIPESEMRQLGSRGRRRRGRRDTIRSSLLHEWAHVFQDRDLVSEPYDREGGANLFEIKTGRKLKRRGVLKRGVLSGTAQTRDFTAKYGKGYWRRGQFGANYGANPTAITDLPQPAQPVAKRRRVRRKR